MTHAYLAQTGTGIFLESNEGHKEGPGKLPDDVNEGTQTKYTSGCALHHICR